MELIKKTEVEKLGLTETKAKEIASIYVPMVAMLEEMEEQFNEVVSQDITADLIPRAKRLRLDIAKVRTTADKARKSAKDEYLRAGNAIQGAYNTLKYAVESKETKLLEIEKHFEKIEAERLEALRINRWEKLSPYIEMEPAGLAEMEEDVFKYLLAGKIQEKKDRIEAEKKAEAERIAKEKAEKEERERIRKENEQLKKEAEERERLAKIEADKRAKIEAERKAKEDAERKQREEEQRKEREQYEAKLKAEREAREKAEREEAAKRQKLQDELRAKEDAEAKRIAAHEAAKEAEANKGDAAKVKDLINDLAALKAKYTFKSKKNQSMYSGVCNLIDKVINYIG